MSPKTILMTVLLGFFLTFLPACSGGNSPNASAPVPTAPAEMAEGEKLFNNNCAGCHGPGAKGTDRGPTFLSKIYEPNHHGDSAFRLAAKNGVRAHHWKFGNMPKIRGLASGEIGKIIDYVRWLQKEDGIF